MRPVEPRWGGFHYSGMKGNGEDSSSFFSEDYFKKRGSWSNSISQDIDPPTQKKRGSVPCVATGMLEETSPAYSYPPQPPAYPQWLPAASPDSEDDSIDRLPYMCRSQAGSRKAQAIIQRASQGVKDQIVSVLCRVNLADLMVDSYGNYMCQTLFENCSAAQRLHLLRHLSNSLVSVAMDSRGTHALQKLISLVNLPEEITILLQAFSPLVVRLATDPNASHVLQKVITIARGNPALILPIATNIDTLATNQLGLLAVKMCISFAVGDEKTYLLRKLLEHCAMLVQDAFGNIAIQHMLEEWSWSYCQDIMHCVRGRVVQLALQKFSSNFIERCLELATEQHRDLLLAELANPPRLRDLLDNRFGQFVLKKALSIGGFSFKTDLQRALRTLPPGLLSQRRKGKWEPIMKELEE